jgi:hypothetical protein
MDQTLAGAMRLLSGGVVDLDGVESQLWADPRLIEELVGLWQCQIHDARSSTTFQPSADDYDAV